MMKEVLESPWGRLFRNWEQVRTTADGYEDIGTAAAEIQLTGMRALRESVGILGTCIREAPEFAARQQHQRQ
jgi:hypothetical protein